MSDRGASTVRRAAVLLLVAAAVLVAPSAALAVTQAPGGVRIGQAPTLPSGTTLVRGEATVSSMRITVALESRDPAALDSYAQAVTNPASSDYHRYLSTARFARRFGPTAAAIAAVKSSLRAHGLDPGAVSANGLGISVRASSAAIDSAFSLTLAEVRLTDGTSAVYNSQAPEVAGAVADDVQAVVGLNGLAEEEPTDIHESQARTTSLISAGSTTKAHDTKHVVTGGPQPCSAVKNAASGDGEYTADQIASAYSFSGIYEAGDEGQGVTIGVYELEPNLTSDIAAFQSCYGTTASVSYVKVDGGAGNGQGGAGEGEAALDIEQVISYAPKAKIIVYQGPNAAVDSPGSGPYDVYEEMISQDKAQVITTSWGDCEAAEGAANAAAESTLFQEAAIQGQTIVAAAGDDGSEDCYDAGPGFNNDTALAVDDPSSQPFVTGAGGTDLMAAGTPPTESAWNGNCVGSNNQPAACAGGGGVSEFWAMPAYQASAAPWLNVIQADSDSAANTDSCPGGQPYCRESPDVSADADPAQGYEIYWNGTGVAGNSQPKGWSGIGGTSAVAPLWAAIFALADADKACTSPIGFANPILYRLASESPAAYASYFNDVTSGYNDMNGKDFVPVGELYPADQYYDMATGLGSPVVSDLVPGLCSQEVALNAPSAKGSWKGAKVKMQLRATLPAGVTGPVTYTAKHLPAGLKLNGSTGLISGVAKRLGTKSVLVKANAGADNFGAARFNWTVDLRPTVADVSLTGAAGGAPALSFTLTGGKDEPAFHVITVELPTGLSASKHTSGIAVFTAAGKHIGRSIKVAGHLVTITLKSASTVTRIDFRAGALRDTAALRAGASTATAAPVRVAITTVDAAGSKASLRPDVRPLG